MGLATLSVNHTAAKVNVKSTREVAETLFKIYDQLKPLFEGEQNSLLYKAYDYDGVFESDKDGYNAMFNKLSDEAVALSTAGHRLQAIADDMQRVVDLFTAEHLEEIRMSSSGVHDFTGSGMTTMVFGKGETITAQ